MRVDASVYFEGYLRLEVMLKDEKKKDFLHLSVNPKEESMRVNYFTFKS